VQKFEVFKPTGGGRRSLSGRFVTIADRGTMSFSEDAWALLGKPEAVQFLVDPGSRGRLVGFCACGRGEPSSHPAMGSTRAVRAGLLLKSLGYQSGETRRYTLRVEEGLPPYIDLTGALPPGWLHRFHRHFANDAVHRDGGPECDQPGTPRRVYVFDPEYLSEHELIVARYAIAHPEQFTPQEEDSP